MGFTKTHNLIYISILALLIGFAIKFFFSFSRKHELMTVISSIEKIENIFQNNRNSDRFPRVAIGFGGCTDYITRATNIFEAINMTAPHSEGILSAIISEEINSSDDLNTIFSKFFVEGAAAERYIHNRDLFSQFVGALKSNKDIQMFAGGNALVMANRIAHEGANLLLGAKLSETQSRFLHENVSYVSKATSKEHEDIHILLEYDVGEKWGALRSPRANRFIIHRDENTPYLKGLEELKETITAFQPDLFVLGGLQMMDDFPYSKGEKEREVEKLHGFLTSLSTSYPVHFEMASFVDKDLLMMLKNKVIPQSDSLGFNEQELPNLLSVLERDTVTRVSSAYPRTSVMLDEMRKVWELLVDGRGGTQATEAAANGRQRQRLSRLHLHTIGYQIIMTDRHSPFWFSSRVAVAKASLVAHRHTCGIDNVDAERSKLLMDDSFGISSIPNSPRVHFNSSNPVSCWEEREVEFCVAPVLVCTKVIRTAGGGDNISSAALISQLKHRGG